MRQAAYNDAEAGTTRAVFGTIAGMKSERDIVLLCNPRAGGRWRELAKILDSHEARFARRIVTDDIGDIESVLSDLGQKVGLICIYGGDGTIQKIITEMYRRHGQQTAALALIGGGTMNVTSRWLGYRGTPEDNFRDVVQRYRADRLIYREVPLLEVHQGERVEYGFTYGVGPAIRVLDRYEHGSKSKISAAAMFAGTLLSAYLRWPRQYASLTDPMIGEISFDGQKLPFDRWMVFFCNTTGTIEIGISPFNHERTRETFHALAYASTVREIVTLVPFLAFGKPPLDPKVLLQPTSAWRQLGMSYIGKGTLPLDPRYINRPASTVRIKCDEKVFTVDGEVLESDGQDFEIKLGPVIRMATRPRDDVALKVVPPT
jgi:hypothetical protein